MNLHPKNIIRFLLYLLILGITLPFVLGFLNKFSPVFDSFSHFRVHLLIILLPLLFIIAFFHEKRMTFTYFALVGIGAFYLYWITQPFKVTQIDKNKTHQLKHLQYNLNFRNQRMEEFKAYLKETKPDIVTLQEVTPAHREILQEMQTNPYSLNFSNTYPYVSQKKGEYPYQAYCNFQVVGAVAILSKHPFNTKQSACLEGLGFIWSQVLVEEQPINVVSIHLRWPYPSPQAMQVDTISPIFQHISSPLLVAGDFNSVSWSRSVNEMSKTSNTKVVDGLRWSISLKKQLPMLPFMKLSIDHVMLSKEFQVEEIFVEKDLGSDHFPIVSTIRY